MRIGTSVGFLLVMVGSASNAFAHQRCFDVWSRLTTSFGACTDDFSSPLGLCSSGRLRGWDLSGNTRFRALSAAYSAGMPEVEAATTLSYSGDLEISTWQGTLRLKDVGLSDVAAWLVDLHSWIPQGTRKVLVGAAYEVVVDHDFPAVLFDQQVDCVGANQSGATDHDNLFSFQIHSSRILF